MGSLLGRQWVLVFREFLKLSIFSDHSNNRYGWINGLQDSNRAELAAAKNAISMAVENGYRGITINSDSQYVKEAVDNSAFYQQWVLFRFLGKPVVFPRFSRNFNTILFQISCRETWSPAINPRHEEKNRCQRSAHRGSLRNPWQQQGPWVRQYGSWQRAASVIPVASVTPIQTVNLL